MHCKDNWRCLLLASILLLVVGREQVSCKGERTLQHQNANKAHKLPGAEAAIVRVRRQAAGGRLARSSTEEEEDAAAGFGEDGDDQLRDDNWKPARRLRARSRAAASSSSSASALAGAPSTSSSMMSQSREDLAPMPPPPPPPSPSTQLSMKPNREPKFTASAAQLHDSDQPDSGFEAGQSWQEPLEPTPQRKKSPLAERRKEFARKPAGGGSRVGANSRGNHQRDGNDRDRDRERDDDDCDEDSRNRPDINDFMPMLSDFRQMMNTASSSAAAALVIAIIISIIIIRVAGGVGPLNALLASC